MEDPTHELKDHLHNKVTAFIGHSGVGKSTLANRLIPEADRATGDVSGIGKAATPPPSSWPLSFPTAGWIIDSPGIRSFGLAHITPETVVAAFDDLSELAEKCPRGLYSPRGTLRSRTVNGMKH